MTHDLALLGCTPEPLMNYLKALGIFRLVAEQADPQAKLSWRSGIAHLESTLDRDALVDFFTNQYRPTPIVVPWSGGDFFGINPDGNSGPFKKCPTSTRVIEAFLATKTDRLKPYREVLGQVLQAMHDCNVHTKADIEGAANKKVKSHFVAILRSRLPETVVDWLDAAAQPEEDSTAFNPLLGSGGGNDGNTHFSDNFMQNLWDSLPDFDNQRVAESSKPSVAHALFNELAGQLSERTGALYDSGAVGGPNATQGFKREFLVNPWNFVLALEGLLIFAGGLAKRAGSQSLASSSFPFLIRMSAAGSDFGSATNKEYGQHEVWLPLWNRASTFNEVSHFFREGRAQVGRRAARNGVDMARAVSTKGVSAGIDEFRRYGLIRGRVGGENYFTAAAIGSYQVRYNSSVTLLEQIDPWLMKFEYALRDGDVPSRYRTQFQKLDRVITDYCRSSRNSSSDVALTSVIEEIGRTERILSLGQAFCKKQSIRPIQGLSPSWLKRADDHSPEFRLAAAIASIEGNRDGIAPFRAFLETVVFKGNYADWSPGSTSAVWSNRPLAANLAAVFKRRQMEAFRNGLNAVPLKSQRTAPLSDVINFLHGDINEDKLTALLWALPGIDWSNVEWISPVLRGGDVSHVPFEFGLPRLLVEPLSLRSFTDQKGNKYWYRGLASHTTVPDPDVFHLLASGRGDAINQSVTRAARRLKSSGLLANGYRNSRQSGSAVSVTSNISSERLLAAMLFPLSDQDLELIANQVLYPPETEE
jgi:CRISPR-associated protein Csx17